LKCIKAGHVTPERERERERRLQQLLVQIADAWMGTVQRRSGT